MSLLTVLSIIYALVLVVALAVGLVSIAFFLHRAKRDLGGIAQGLTEVDRNVAPLSSALAAVNDALEDISGHLGKADRNLAAARPQVAEERRIV